MASDPYRNFKWEVELDGFTHAGFSKVSGLKHTVQVIDYREGGENEKMHKIPGQSTFDPVTLERGMSNNSDFLNWMKQVFDLDSEGGFQGDDNIRRDLVIYLKNKSGARVVEWTIYRAWPSEKNAGDLDAAGNDVLIESLVLQNEGIRERRL